MMGDVLMFKRPAGAKTNRVPQMEIAADPRAAFREAAADAIAFGLFSRDDALVRVAHGAVIALASIPPDGGRAA